MNHRRDPRSAERRSPFHLPGDAEPTTGPAVGPNGLGRRAFIAGVGATVVLAACGSDDGGDGGGAEETDPGDSTDTGASADTTDLEVADEFTGDSADLAPGTFTLAQRFPSAVLVPGEVRLPHSLFRDAEFVNDGPATLGAQVVDLDGEPIGERMIADRQDVTPGAYYVWRPTVDAAGFYFLVVDGGPEEGAAFQVVEPAAVAVPGQGEPLPGFDTPTAEDPAGVDPICTRDPFCPFHEVTLTEALADGRGVAYLVGTPAFCQTGTCAPALEAMIEVAEEFADDFVFVHAEVFTDLTAQELTPAIGALSMSYEPALFITDGDGTIVDRLDAIWGVDELRDRLAIARG